MEYKYNCPISKISGFFNFFLDIFLVRTFSTCSKLQLMAKILEINTGWTFFLPEAKLFIFQYNQTILFKSLMSHDLVGDFEISRNEVRNRLVNFNFLELWKFQKILTKIAAPRSEVLHVQPNLTENYISLQIMAINFAGKQKNKSFWWSMTFFEQD